MTRRAAQLGARLVEELAGLLLWPLIWWADRHEEQLYAIGREDVREYLAEPGPLALYPMGTPAAAGTSYTAVPLGDDLMKVAEAAGVTPNPLPSNDDREQTR